MNTAPTNISEFDYELPEDKIPRYPIQKRDCSKLLVYQPENKIRHKPFSSIIDVLPDNSLLVFNNTKVIYARLHFRKSTGAKIEIFCLSPVEPSNYQVCFSSIESCTWKCMVGNLKKWKDEELFLELNFSGIQIQLGAKKIKTEDNLVTVKFSWDKPISFAEILNMAGNIPIPPYLSRESEYIDTVRYQTVFSKHEGSVAAPTAGLHFTPALIDQLHEKGHQTGELTLHVGAGTFQPVKTEDFSKHQMHQEQLYVSKELIKKIIAHKGSVIPVGTTALRTLESIYWLGVKALSKQCISQLAQWEYQKFKLDIPPIEALEALLHTMKRQKINQISASSEIMITPGYKFRLSDALITNFHQPKSTLLLLVSALIGEKWKDVYDYALNNDFKFLSYGDSSILFNASKNGN